ncbi:hypothetical protein [Caulobacter hibisci]|uniref:Lipoprotein n=1 Tax=Caulobacter hibisci TaxID=2035993 RepID=A0ABS0T1G5_9CAUL|nr:hypothetical protein [Caulobacter hibisci]MBI1684763.1 hypothetical protein [Caulobacter hibisci]
MRSVIIVGAWVLAAATAGCAAKPKPAIATASCPPLTAAQWQPPALKAHHDLFDAALRHRFGDIGTHGLFEHTEEARGTVVTVRRIGPARFEMPAPGQGGELEIVLERCTAKVLKVRKLADLEAEPKPIAPDQDPAD